MYERLSLGVTGTTKGATRLQLTQLDNVLTTWHYAEFHHGDAVGVDAQSHAIVSSLADMPGFPLGRPWITVHPPVNPVKRAFCQGDEMREPDEYLIRDHDIANEVNILVAVPETAKEQLRSGTWTTVRYARKRKVVFIIRINPDGTIEFG